MEIRKAVAGDLKKIQELNLMLFEKEKREYDELLDLNWTFGEEGTSHFKDAINKDDACAFVVENNGKIVGYLVGGISEVENYRNAPKSAELDNMLVLEECRGMGVGGMLYDVFVEWCKDREVKMLRVNASAGNREAIGFYRKSGFEDYSLTLERKL